MYKLLACSLLDLFSKTFDTVNTALKSKLILLTHLQSYSYMPIA